MTRFGTIVLVAGLATIAAAAPAAQQAGWSAEQSTDADAVITSQGGPTEALAEGEGSLQVDQAVMGGPCSCSQLWFHAMYGDSTQTCPHDADLRASYAAYPNFEMWIAPHNPQDTDDPGWAIDSWYPFILDGYCSFDPTTVTSAQLRFDVFYERHTSLYTNDSISFWNEASNGTAGGYAFAPDLLRAIGPAPGPGRGFWVAVCMDLVGGNVYAARIDDFGVGLDAPNCLGRIGSVPSTVRKAILNAASDGDLQGIIQDDLSLGFVSLSGFAKPPLDCLCPYRVDLREGRYVTSDPNSLCADDQNRLVVESARPSALQRVARWWGEFRVPPGPACELSVQVQGHRTGSGGRVRISLWNWSSGRFEGIGEVAMGEVTDLGGELTVCEADRFVDAGGNVRVEVYSQRDRVPRNFELRIDLLTICVRR